MKAEIKAGMLANRQKIEETKRAASGKPAAKASAQADEVEDEVEEEDIPYKEESI